MASPFSSKTRHIVWFALLAGGLLALIGVRFILVPESAARTFGLARARQGYELHAIIGLRDLWLAGLAIAFALLGEWRALALWLGLGAVVCFADALIVALSSGRAHAIAFHVGSGVFCAALALASWRAAGRAIAKDLAKRGPGSEDAS